MQINRYTQEQKDFVVKNVVNAEQTLVDMFNAEFGTNVSISKLENLKHRLKIKSGLVGGRFKKGHSAHNKGKKWDEYMSKEGQVKSSKTTFKKGNIPHNHRPVGSERLSKDGYIEVKIAEPNKWIGKHRLVWEQANGEIPKGYKMAFLDGDRQNVRLENLTILPLNEQLIMNRNKLFTDNAEATKTGLLISKLMQKSRELAKSRRTNERN